VERVFEWRSGGEEQLKGRERNWPSGGFCACWGNYISVPEVAGSQRAISYRERLVQWIAAPPSALLRWKPCVGLPKVVEEPPAGHKLERRGQCRTCLYLNNIIEQDHRAVQQRVTEARKDERTCPLNYAGRFHVVLAHFEVIGLTVGARAPRKRLGIGMSNKRHPAPTRVEGMPWGARRSRTLVVSHWRLPHLRMRVDRRCGRLLSGTVRATSRT
jgi:hypothetical protein